VKRLLPLLMMTFLYGCAGNMQQPMSSANLNALKGADTLDVYSQSAVFWLQTTKTAARDGGFIGGLLPKYVDEKTGAVNIPSGMEMIKDYKLPLPVDLVKDELVKNLNQQLGGEVATFNDKPVALNEEFDEFFAKDRVFSDYYLLVENTSWMSSYTPFDWDTQFVAIHASATLGRRSDNKVMWKGTCNVNGLKDPYMNVDTAKLLEDGAAKLKDIIAYGAKGCAKELLDQMRVQ